MLFEINIRNIVHIGAVIALGIVIDCAWGQTGAVQEDVEEPMEILRAEQNGEENTEEEVVVDEGAEEREPLDAATLRESADEAPSQEFLATDDEVTIPPDLTVFESVKHVMDQIPIALNYREMLSTNTINEIKTSPSTFSTDKPVLWKTALEEVISPHELDFLIDDDIVRIGPSEVIQQHYRELEQEQLSRNHTRIQVNFSEGTKLYLALRMIQSQAGININFDYMDPVDRGIEEPAGREADDVEEQRPQGNLTTYATPENQAVQWRTVMHEVLNPFGYDFIEVNGVVRPMKMADVEQWKIDQINAKPIETRLVRIYHASPSDIVNRLKNMKFLLKHVNAFVEMVSSDNDKQSHSKRYPGSGLQSTSSGGEGEQIGAEMQDSVSYGNMERPRTPPAILIGDIESNLDRIEAEIKKLDERGIQVLIEAKIFEVGVKSDRKLGVDWEELTGEADFSSTLAHEQSWTKTESSKRDDADSYDTRSAFHEERDLLEDEEIARTGNQTYDGVLTDNLDTVFQRTFSKVSESAFTGILNPLEFSFYWQAVRQQNDFKNLSQPVVVIGDHSEAVIRVGTIIPAYRKASRFIENNVEESYEWQMIQTGISLWVIPEIAEDGKTIRLSIHPQESSVGEYVTAGKDGEGGRYPAIEIREVDTRVSVPNGNTLMLGGLIRGEDSQIQRKVPLLGDIPILGRLFRWDSDARDGRNLVILLTPTILDKDDPDTGYEKPSQPFIDDLSRGLGRDLTNSVPSVERVIKERKEREDDLSRGLGRDKTNSVPSSEQVIKEIRGEAKDDK